MAKLELTLGAGPEVTILGACSIGDGETCPHCNGWKAPEEDVCPECEEDFARDAEDSEDEDSEDWEDDQ